MENLQLRVGRINPDPDSVFGSVQNEEVGVAGSFKSGVVVVAGFVEGEGPAVKLDVPDGGDRGELGVDGVQEIAGRAVSEAGFAVDLR